MNKLIIAGGSGFLGNAIAEYFKNTFQEIVILTRGISELKNGFRYVSWDAKNSGKWVDEFKNCDVLINMAGRSVDCRYTEENKKLILSSRVESTQILNKAVSKCINPPKIWLNASTATIYRHSEDKQMDEVSGEIGTGFSVGIATAWEAAFFKNSLPKTRRVALRTAIVLAKKDGAFVPIKKLAQFGFGGKQGNGNQLFSWIHIDDFLRSIAFIIKNDFLEGPINNSAPKPITNTHLMKSVREAVKISFGCPLPKTILEIGAKLINTETELVLKSRNVIPKKLADAGFKFQHKTIESALKHLV